MKPSSLSNPQPQGKLRSLMIHSAEHSSEEVIFNPNVFTDLQEGSYVKIFDVERPHNKLVVRVPPFGNVSGRLEVSLSKSVAEAFALQPFSKVLVEEVPSVRDVEVDFVEVAFRRQYLQRGNMWRFKRSLVGRAVHTQQNVVIDGVAAQVLEMSAGGNSVTSGVISENTNVIFRSRSARIYWLVQITSEMWAFDQNGDLYFEKFLSKFVIPVLDKWKALNVTHSLTIVYFARSLVVNLKDINESLIDQTGDGDASIDRLDRSHTRTVVTEEDGVYYQDFFKVVAEAVADMEKVKVLQILKKEFWSFPKVVGWNVSTDANKSVHRFAVPSDAANGNFLEAVNTTLNLLDKHYMDRDLTRTGGSIVIISAGTGIFKVEPVLAQITKQRMMDNGIGIDYISLSQPPLHIVPLFMVMPSINTANASDGTSSSGPGGFFEVPHWMNVSYVDCEPAVVVERSKQLTGASSSLVHSSGRGGMEVSSQVSKDMKHKWTGARDFQNLASMWGGGETQLSDDQLKAAQRELLANAAEGETGGGKGMSLEMMQSERWAKIFRPLAFSDVLWTQADVLNALMQEALRNDVSCASANKRAVVKASAMGLARNNYASAYFQLISLPPPLRHYVLASFSESKRAEEESVSAPPLKSFTSPAWPWGFVPLNTLLRPDQSDNLPYRDQELDELLRILPPPDIFDVTDGNAVTKSRHRRHALRDEDGDVFVNLKRNDSEFSVVSEHSGNAIEGRPRLNSAGSIDSTTGLDLMDAVLGNVENTSSFFAKTSSMGSVQTTSIPRSGSSSSLRRNLSSHSRLGSLNSNSLDNLFMDDARSRSSRDDFFHVAATNLDKTAFEAMLYKYDTYAFSKNAMSKERQLIFMKEVCAGLDVPSSRNSVSPDIAKIILESGVEALNSDEAVKPSAMSNKSLSPGPQSREAKPGRINNDAVVGSRAGIPSSASKSKLPPPAAAASSFRGSRTPMLSTGPRTDKSTESMSSAGSQVNKSLSKPITIPSKTAASGRVIQEQRLALSAGNESSLSASLSSSLKALNQGSRYLERSNSRGGGGSRATAIASLGFLVPSDNVNNDDGSDDDSDHSVDQSRSEDENSGVMEGLARSSASAPIAVVDNAASSMEPHDSDASSSSAAATPQGRSVLGHFVKLGEDVDNSEELARQRLGISPSVRTGDHLHEAMLSSSQPTIVDLGGKGIPSLNRAASKVLEQKRFGFSRRPGAPGSITSQYTSGGGTATAVGPTLVTNQDLRGVDASKQQETSINQFTENYRKRYGINPFREQEGKKYLKARTHNRRRWMHVFPSGGKDEGWQLQHTLNMKSLCQPAMLPLTTDYLPPVKDIEGNVNPYNAQVVQANQYSESNYTLILDPTVCPFTTPENLLLEMVGQRLVQEYQLTKGIDIESYKKLIPGLVEGSESKTAMNQEQSTQFYVLSMGHRIQFLAYLPARSEVKVSRYVTTGVQSTATYKYEVWVPQLQRFQRVSQTFKQYPDPEYNWNVHDEILLGNMDQLPETIKPKRLRYAIVPDTLKTAEERDAYFGNFKELLSFLQKGYAADAEIKVTCDNPAVVAAVPSDMLPHLNKFEGYSKSTTESDASISGSDSAASVTPTTSSATSAQPVTRTVSDTVKLWLRGPRHENPKWIYLKYNSTFSFQKVYHLEFYWITADSWTIDDFVTLFFRRCSKLGLKLVQIPEYFCGSNLQVHPYRAQPYIPPALLDAQMKELMSKLPNRSEALFSESISDFLDPKLRSLYLEKCVLFDRPQEWLRDDDRRTDWPAYLVDAAEDGFSLSIAASASSSAAAGSSSAGLAAGAPSASATSTLQSTPLRSAMGTRSSNSGVINSGGPNGAGDKSAFRPPVSGGIGKAVGITSAPSESVASGHNNSTSSEPPRIASAPALAPGASAGVGGLGVAATTTTSSSSSSASIRGTIPGRRTATAVVLDRQYMHRSGLACVRVVPSGGFVWLLNSSARVSDAAMSVEERKELAQHILKDFQSNCAAGIHRMAPILAQTSTAPSNIGPHVDN